MTPADRRTDVAVALRSLSETSLHEGAQARADRSLSNASSDLFASSFDAEGFGLGDALRDPLSRSLISALSARDQLGMLPAVAAGYERLLRRAGLDLRQRLAMAETASRRPARI